jgi:hypothetical protein
MEARQKRCVAAKPRAHTKLKRTPTAEMRPKSATMPKPMATKDPRATWIFWYAQLCE